VSVGPSKKPINKVEGTANKSSLNTAGGHVQISLDFGICAGMRNNDVIVEEKGDEEGKSFTNKGKSKKVSKNRG
jgi:hypothetical protein